MFFFQSQPDNLLLENTLGVFWLWIPQKQIVDKGLCAAGLSGKLSWRHDWGPGRSKWSDGKGNAKLYHPVDRLQEWLRLDSARSPEYLCLMCLNCPSEGWRWGALSAAYLLTHCLRISLACQKIRKELRWDPSEVSYFLIFLFFLLRKHCLILV